MYKIILQGGPFDGDKHEFKPETLINGEISIKRGAIPYAKYVRTLKLDLEGYELYDYVPEVQKN